ncbi:hypothetical protein C8J56DRAFT_901854 [Mycena floridula]|nr:hypothetical protein C8J56DRAFT_901854 [Mycena floridula]
MCCCSGPVLFLSFSADQASADQARTTRFGAGQAHYYLLLGREIPLDMVSVGASAIGTRAELSSIVVRLEKTSNNERDKWAGTESISPAPQDIMQDSERRVRREKVTTEDDRETISKEKKKSKKKSRVEKPSSRRSHP